MANKAKRTEHAGAKNGGGYRGHRADAKRESAKGRREEDRRESRVPNAETRAAMRELDRGDLPRVKDVRSLLAELNEEDDAALLQHVHQIGHIPGPDEVVFVAPGSLPYAAPSLEWLVVALREVLGVKLPASVRKAVETILAAPRSRRKLPPLPVVVRSGGRLSVHAVDLAASCPPPHMPPPRVKLTVEFDRETDGRWIAEVPELRGVLVYGESREQARAKALSLAHQVLAEGIVRPTPRGLKRGSKPPGRTFRP